MYKLNSIINNVRSDNYRQVTLIFCLQDSQIYQPSSMVIYYKILLICKLIGFDLATNISLLFLKDHSNSSMGTLREPLKGEIMPV